ncbi:MAG: GNAT family N-acetyltransferase [Candidatus Hodarchaeales archaeon]
MKLYYRELVSEDIPAVRLMVNEIWEGYDYVSTVIGRWIDDKKSYTYGVFTGNQIVGLGNIRWLIKDIAWMEGGRVYPPLQGQGIGTGVFKHAIEVAKSRGSRIVQYSTATTNAASLKLGYNNNFTKIDEMAILWRDIQDINEKNASQDHKQLKVVSADEAHNILRKVSNGPGKSVCTGWSYIPLDPALLAQQVGQWYTTGDSIALVISKSDVTDGNTSEYPVNKIWIILYGDTKDAVNLLRLIVIKYRHAAVEGMQVYCPRILEPVVKESGFIDRDNDSLGVVLLEKKFND